MKHFSDTVFRCTLCGNCQEVCPIGIHLKDLWLSLRQDMVHSKSYPKKINMIRDNLAEDHNRRLFYGMHRRLFSPGPENPHSPSENF